MSSTGTSPSSATNTLHDRLAALVDFAVCPDNHQPLHIAPAALVERLNDLIAQRSLRDRSATLLDDRLQALLVREDHALGYAVRHDIPVLLKDAAILLTDEDRAML